MFKYKHKLRHLREDVGEAVVANRWLKPLLLVVAVYFAVCLGLGIYWSFPPKTFNVVEAALEHRATQDANLATGAVTTATTIKIAQTLLHKRGGFLYNDVFPPGAWLDNMPNWEYGALIQVRDMTKAMREVLSRSQSQSSEDPDLSIAEPRFNFSADSWVLPRSEGMYAQGIEHLDLYLLRLSDPNEPKAQFYARADNLTHWLGMVSARLGSLSQRLSASVAQNRINTDLAGDAGASQSTPVDSEIKVKTPWHEIDDVYFEARGASWALLMMLQAAEVDFANVLARKNADASLRSIIRELENTQEPLRSPIILNGSGFGMLANHSLVMASYISRANTAVIELRSLLLQG